MRLLQVVIHGRKGHVPQVVRVQALPSASPVDVCPTWRKGGAFFYFHSSKAKSCKD